MVTRFAVGLPLVKVSSGHLLDRCMSLAFSECLDLSVQREPTNGTKRAILDCEWGENALLQEN